MPFHEFFEAVEATPVGVFMRENVLAFPLVESIHVLALTFVVGSIGMVDLRLLGVSARNHAVTRFSNEIVPITWVAFVVAAITGGLLFTSKASEYVSNFFFVGKMVLMALAGMNMAIFEFFTYRSVKNWDSDTPTPFAAKLAAGLSLSFWLGVIVFGRWIGFTVGGAS
jgi:general stress protein CsbA